MTGRPTEAGLASSRLENLADGVFATAMTLLVFAVPVPGVSADPDEGGLARALVALGPKLLACVFSFLVVGSCWIGHQNTFRWIARVDRTLVWINLVLLLAVVGVPFSAALVGRYGAAEPIALAVYGAHLLAIALLLVLHWTYATSRPALLEAGGGPLSGAARVMTVKILRPVPFYLAGISLAWSHPGASLSAYALAFVASVAPGAIDRHLGADPVGERR